MSAHLLTSDGRHLPLAGRLSSRRLRRLSSYLASGELTSGEFLHWWAKLSADPTCRPVWSNWTDHRTGRSRRGFGPARCDAGHLWRLGDNLYLAPNGERSCRACIRARKEAQAA